MNLSKFDKILDEIFKDPYSRNLTFDKIANFLLCLGCLKPKNKGTSHRLFIHPDFPTTPVGLVKNKELKRYQIMELRALLENMGINPK